MVSFCEFFKEKLLVLPIKSLQATKETIKERDNLEKRVVELRENLNALNT